MRRRTASLWHRLTTRSVVTLAVVLVVALMAGASAWALTTGSGADYRTAAAVTGNVEQTLDATGTIQPVNTAQLSFQVAGQVASVTATVGQDVTDGEVLATLDTSSLQSTVDSDQSAVTSAQTKLADDEASEASASKTTTTTTTTTTPANSSNSSTATSAAIGAAQATLTSDQHKLDGDSAQAKSDLTAATTACAASTGSACTTALQTELADQQTVAQDEQTVAQDESNLSSLLSSSASSSTTSTGRSGSGSSSPTEAAADTSTDADTGTDADTSTDTGSNAAPGAQSSESAAATPYEVAADQADLDADDVVLSEAEAALDEAQLTSPMSGVVASVAVTAGENVSADSSSEEIVVIGPQAFEVSTTVDVSDVSEVKVGEKASVTLDGQGGVLPGTVSEVGPPPVSTTSTDYPVVIALPAGAQGLYDGASASVAIVVGEATDVVTVPTSALHELSRLSYVDEVHIGALEEVRVTVGAMGETSTQVTSGVKVGDEVVLANLSEPVPTNTTTGPGSFAGVGALTGTGGGGFGGGGAGGGGFSRRAG